MNYTQNHHLPQWEETDRVLMTNFNEAMLSIEASLTEGAGNTAHLDRWAENMARDLYRQAVQQAVHHGRCGLTDSMWLNPLASVEDAAGCGWNGQYGVHLGGEIAPTVAGIEATAKEISIVSTMGTPFGISDIAQTDFTSDGFGMLNTVTVWSYREQAYPDEYAFTVTLTRLDTGEVTASAGPFTSLSGPNSTVTQVLTVNFPLESQIKYRLSFSRGTGNSFKGISGFVLKGDHFNGSAVPLTVSSRKPNSSITNTVTTPDYAKTAIPLLRWQGAGAVTLSVNGIPLTASRTRTALNAVGATCQEVEYSPIPLTGTALTVRADMDAGGGELDLFDYGLLWR